MLKIKSFAFLLLSVLFFNSCSIEKRLHQSGYHIVKKSDYQKGKTQEHKNAPDDITEDLAQSVSDETSPSRTKAIRSELQDNRAEESEIKSSEKRQVASADTAIKVKSSKKKGYSIVQPNKIKSKSNTTTEEIASDYSMELQESNKKSNNLLGDSMKILILILCFLLPPVAVWLLTEDGTTLLISILLWLFFVIPGIVFALYHFFQRY